MAQMIIRLECDRVTGKKNIVIKLLSDPDALPLEHEQQHRALVDKLIEGGSVKASELGKIIVERQEEQTTSADLAGTQPQAERKAEVQGS
jgi:hypothetical protein